MVNNSVKSSDKSIRVTGEISNGRTVVLSLILAHISCFHYSGKPKVSPAIFRHLPSLLQC